MNSLYTNAAIHNRQNILDLAGQIRAPKFLDLGCDDGRWTEKVAAAARATEVHGVEITPGRADIAAGHGVIVINGDLARDIPLPDRSFDLIHANQVIEHVPDVDHFAGEILRLLKPGGRFIVSTENGSSWHNVFATAMGWQCFSLTNMSAQRGGIGNPWALHRGKAIAVKSWTHKTIFSYRGLLEFFAAFGFEDLRIVGAGYYPFPTGFARWDVRHAHFITISGVKPGGAR